MESIESHNNFALRPLSGLNLQGQVQHRNKMAKISSADSLLSMIRNIASSKLNTSTPSSPQLSDNGDVASSGFPTPLSTPDTPNGSYLSLHAGTSKNATKVPGSGSQIMVSVLNPLNPKKSTDSQENQPQKSQVSADGPPTITLEVPSFSYGKCLSPIREMPSPLPTPCPSPLPTPNMARQQIVVNEDQSGGASDGSSSLSYGSSVSRSSSIRKHINKAKTVPQDQAKHESIVKCHSVSNDSYSFDSGEGTFDNQDFGDGGTSDFSEISIPIPSFRSSSSSSNEIRSPINQSSTSSIPIIMTSLYDSSENLCKPVPESIPKPSTRNKRLVKQRHIPPNIIIPQVSISCEDDVPNSTKSPNSSNSSSSSSPVISPSGRIKKKPPPLVIPDSNFFNFKDDVQSAPVVTISVVPAELYEGDDSKQTKATSLDKNITLFKQKSFDESLEKLENDNASFLARDDQNLIEKSESTDDKCTFLGNTNELCYF